MPASSHGQAGPNKQPGQSSRRLPAQSATNHEIRPSNGQAFLPPRRSPMKPWHAATATIAVVACCAGVWGFQRTADFGFGNDDSPTNVKSEFYWSRLAYSSSMQGLGGNGRRGWVT